MGLTFDALVMSLYVIVLIVLYSLVFAVVYAQLVAIWYLQYKRFSYQTAFLFLFLFLSYLRITLFSAYVQDIVFSNQYPVFYYGLLNFPIVIQFCILCLLVLYYGQVIYFLSNKVIYFLSNKNDMILFFSKIKALYSNRY